MNSSREQCDEDAPCLPLDKEAAFQASLPGTEQEKPLSIAPGPEADEVAVEEDQLTEERFHTSDARFLEEALALGSLGLRVLPVREGSKQPRQKRWQDKATSDERVIKRWPRKWRRGNLGVATGRGVIAVDVDRKNGGLETLTRLIAMHGPFPPTAEAVTGSGGRHFLFRVPVKRVIGNKVNWEPGIDIKGESGFIVVEPSIHPETGKEYVWVQHPRQGIAEAPSWLLGKLPRHKAHRGRRDKQEATTPATKPVRTPGASRQGDHAQLLKEMKEKFPISGPGCRHAQMVRAVGSMVGREYDEALIRTVMMDWWEHFYALGLTTTDRLNMQAELTACLASTRRNDKFTMARGDGWHRRRYRKIQLSEKQRQLMKANIEIHDLGTKSLSGKAV
jgi:hypothetical protein